MNPFEAPAETEPEVPPGPTPLLDVVAKMGCATTILLFVSVLGALTTLGLGVGLQRPRFLVVFAALVGVIVVLARLQNGVERARRGDASAIAKVLTAHWQLLLATCAFWLLQNFLP